MASLRSATLLDKNMIQEMMRSKIPDGTKRKGKWAITLFRDWLKKRNTEGILQEGQLHVFKDVDELDYLFSLFILEIWTFGEKPIEAHYFGKTLHPWYNIITTLYHNSNEGWSIFKDKKFQRSRNDLDLSKKLSRESEQTVTLEDWVIGQILWDKKICGSDTLTKLLHTLVYL